MAMVRVRNILSGLLLVMLVAACASEPYEVLAPGDAVARFGASAVAAAPKRLAQNSPPPRAIAFCYNGAFSDPAEVLARVKEICPGKGKLFRVDEDVFWNNCSLSKPVRATFICIPGPAKPSKFK